MTGLPLETILPLATEVPARILGVADRKGKLARGYDADLVLLREDLGVDRTFIKGMEMS